jgi:hypothetical protein
MRDFMVERFTIRPRPKDGESFTSYLIRLSNLNGFNYHSILKRFGTKRDRNHYSFDIYPERFLDLDEFSNQVNQNRETIIRLSFQPLLDKFVEFDAISSDNLGLSRLIEQDHRRFCIKCLEEDKYFHLLWQVREIKVCPIHRIELTAKCNVCNREQPYISNFVINGLCHYCHSPLSERVLDNLKTVDGIDDIELQHQSPVLKDWDTLLNPNITLHVNNQLTKDKAIALKLLYLLETKKTTNYKLGSLVYTRKKLRAFINDSKYVSKPQIPETIKVVQKMGIGINEFANLEIPREFQMSVIKEDKEQKLGPCFAPWCPSFGTNESMVQAVYVRNSHNDFHSKKSICMSCFMKYGFDPKTGVWEEMGNDIEFIKSSLIPKVQNATSVAQIVSGLPRRKTEKMLGYMANFDLLPKVLMDKFNSQNHRDSEQVFNMFKELLGEYVGYTTIQSIASKRYGLNPREFSLYYWYPVVQEFLHRRREPATRNLISDDPERQVEKVIFELMDSSIDITLEQVRSRLGWSEGYLYSRGLNNLIRESREKQLQIRKIQRYKNLKSLAMEYIILAQNKDVEIKSKDLYDHLDSKPWLLDYNFTQTLSQEIKKANMDIVK